MINLCNLCEHQNRSLVKCSNCIGHPSQQDNFKQKALRPLEEIVAKTDHKFGSNYNKQGTGRNR